MKEITFKYFAKHHLWLLLAVILIPVLGIGIYCGLFWRCIDESIVATIVMGVISYIGTVAWGLFIYYNSWSNEQLQKYRDRPRLRVGCIRNQNELSLYTGEEVIGKPLKGNDKYADNFVFLKIRITNNGNHAIFNVKPINVLLQIGQEANMPQGINAFINTQTASVFAFKDQCEYYVGLYKTIVGDDLENVNNYVSHIFSFQDDLLNIYYCEMQVWIKGGKQMFPANLNIYTDSEYQKIRNNRVSTIIHG